MVGNSHLKRVLAGSACMVLAAEDTSLVRLALAVAKRGRALLECLRPYIFCGECRQRVLLGAHSSVDCASLAKLFWKLRDVDMTLADLERECSWLEMWAGRGVKT